MPSITSRKISSARALLQRAADASNPAPERLRALRALRSSRGLDLTAGLLPLLARDADPDVQSESLNLLGIQGRDATASEILARWRDLSPSARSAAGSTLASRKPWALALLDRIRDGAVSASDLGAPVIRSLVQHRDDEVRRAAGTAIGRFRDARGLAHGLLVPRPAASDGAWTFYAHPARLATPPRDTSMTHCAMTDTTRAPHS